MPRCPLATHLQHALGAQPAGGLCVAYSGGPDSTALLHALAQLPAARARDLRALHIDHGLHPDSGAWAMQAQAFCATLGVPLEVCRVLVARDAGAGPEAAARHARYAAFAQALQAQEWLLLGHHRDDQVETVLLKLLRGAGPEGLGGMRVSRVLGRGRLWRPLLELPRQTLREYVQVHRLPCIEDPSNADIAFARNRLRHEILPGLQQHWPQAADAILHSAALCRAAADSLRMRWLEAFDALLDPSSGSLDAGGWLALDRALREPLLDHWLHARGLPAPSAAQRRQIERQCAARAGQQPCVRWRDAELHIWKGRLWARTVRPSAASGWQADWHGGPLTLPDGGRLVSEPDACWPMPLQVRLRRGGERIKPLGDAHTRELRDLFQQAAVPPWLRMSCPLLYADGELVAVADLWHSARGAALLAAAGARLHWMPAP